jgi:hypothetical protein
MLFRVPVESLSPTPETHQRIFGGKLPVRFDPLVINQKGEVMSETVIFDPTLPIRPPKVVSF